MSMFTTIEGTVKEEGRRGGGQRDQGEGNGDGIDVLDVLDVLP